MAKIFFSAQTGAFYWSPGSPEMPSDAVEVTADQHADLLQKKNQGWTLSVQSGQVIATETTVQLTPEQITQAKVDLVQNHLDAAAKARGYDSIVTAVTYADEPSAPRFQQEGQAFRAWRSAVWEKCYETLTAVKAGTESVPDDAALIAQLPALVLPDVQQ
jgi:hypothetical protein